MNMHNTTRAITLMLFLIVVAVMLGLLAACGQHKTATATALHGQCFDLMQWAQTQQNTESAASPVSAADGEWGKLTGTRNIEAIENFQRDIVTLTDPSLAPAVKRIKTDLKVLRLAITNRDMTEYRFGSGSLSDDVTRAAQGPCKTELG